MHPLQLFGAFPIPVADLAFLLREGEAFEGKETPGNIRARRRLRYVWEG
jgi:hypothetical protein